MAQKYWRLKYRLVAKINFCRWTFIRQFLWLKREKRISEFQQIDDSNRNSKTYFEVVDAGFSTDEGAAFDYEKPRNARR